NFKMEKNNNSLDSISDVHRLLGLPKPLHPLISLIDNTTNKIDSRKLPQAHVLNFYKISYKTKLNGKLKYGQRYYDFDEGSLLFASPKQVIGNHTEDDVSEHAGYTLLIHPDFFLGHPIANK